MELFNLPIYINADNEYLTKFEEKVDRYKETLKRLGKSKNLNNLIVEMERAIDSADDIKKKIILAFNDFFVGEINSGIDIIASIVLKYKNILIKKISESYAFFGDNVDGEIEKELILFKGRLVDPFSKVDAEDMFHIPFDMRDKIRTQRYSISGVPYLYLAHNSYVVWNELGCTSYDKLAISTFKLKCLDKKILAISTPIEKFHDKLRINKNLSYEMKRAFIEKLPLWIFVLAVSISCKNGQERHFKSEYVIPQLLMYVLKRNNCIGIAYHSTRILSRNGMLATNLAIPMLDYTTQGKTSTFRKKLEISKVLNFQFFCSEIYTNPLHSIATTKTTFNKPVKSSDTYAFKIPYNCTSFYNFDNYLLYLANKLGEYEFV